MKLFERETPLDRLRHRAVVAELLGHVIAHKDLQARKGKSGNGEPRRARAIILHPESPRGRAASSLVMALRNAEVPDSEIWKDIQWISNNYGCFDIRLSPKRSLSDPEWAHAKLIFQDPTEDLVRSWIGVPRVCVTEERWQSLLRDHAEGFEVSMETLEWKRPLIFPAGYDDETLLSCWRSVGAVLQSVQNISWRQLSARCFLADSKFLDAESQQAQVRRLFPTLSRKIVERPILLHIYLPRVVHSVLIIENQDTFTEMADLRPQNTALVYGMGYRAGAARVRQRGVANFSLYGCAVEADQLCDFERWWTEQAVTDLPVYFWGDLDYAGLGIAGSLKCSFPHLMCWRPGYAPALALLESDGGHTPEQTNKSRQRMVGEIGCAYADGFLLPALKASGRFVDQEVVDISALMGSIDI